MTRALLPVLLAGALACGCQDLQAMPQQTVKPPAPLTGVDDAYAEAAKIELEAREAEDYPDLHHLYRLSQNIISGGEPLGEKALDRLAGMGVKTIISVDGKTPNAKAAAARGMRYVHLPIQYNGVTPDELLKITKIFRELEPPFYVHCFHGQHRGPTTSAFGRLIVDGAPRRQALAEMRQWFGTSGSYKCLYKAVATHPIPTPEETARSEFDFPAARPLGGFRSTMVEVTRTFDNIKALAKRDWKADPEHPDVDALNEAEKLAQIFDRSSKLKSVQERPEDFRGWMDVSAAESARMVDAIRNARAGDEKAWTAARKSFRVIKQNCKSCHSDYRNN